MVSVVRCVRNDKSLYTGSGLMVAGFGDLEALK